MDKWQVNVRVTFPLGSSGPKQSGERGGGGGGGGGGKERKKEKKKEKKRKRKKMRIEKLHLLSRIPGDRVVGSLWSKRQSWSTQRELRVSTKISGFRRTPRGRGFSPNRFYSWSKSHSNGMRFVGL